MTDILSIMKCPVCSASFSRKDNSLVCENGHTFDIAKSGYVNMLPPGKAKNSKTGDEKTMVKARCDFLSLGYYDNIGNFAAELLASRFTNKDDLVLCDLGCGEGHHTCNIAKKLSSMTGSDVLALGFDASKYAAERASKLSRSLSMMSADGIGGIPTDELRCVTGSVERSEANTTSDRMICKTLLTDCTRTKEQPLSSLPGKSLAYFMPANIFSLPLYEKCADTVLSMFAPISVEESCRVLKKNGVLLVISSGRDHLSEMRKLIYDDVHFSDEPPLVPKDFREDARESLKYKINLKSVDEIRSLFVMTPFYYKTTEEGYNRLMSNSSLEVTVHVNFSIFIAE